MLPKQQMGSPFQATADNITASAATCSIAGVTGRKHYITDIAAASDLDGATVEVLDGSTVIWQYVLGTVATGQNTIDHTFATPLWGSSGASVYVVVDGSAYDLAKANMAGFTAA